MSQSTSSPTDYKSLPPVFLYALSATALYLDSLLHAPHKLGFHGEKVKPFAGGWQSIYFGFAAFFSLSIFIATFYAYYKESKKFKQQVKTDKKKHKNPVKLGLAIEAGLVKGVIPAFSLIGLMVNSFDLPMWIGIVAAVLALAGTAWCQISVLARKIESKEAESSDSCLPKFFLACYALLNPFLYYNQGLEIPTDLEGHKTAPLGYENVIGLLCIALPCAVMIYGLGQAYLPRLNRIQKQKHEFGQWQYWLAAVASGTKAASTAVDVMQFSSDPKIKFSLLLILALTAVPGIFMCELIVFYQNPIDDAQRIVGAADRTETKPLKV